MKYFNKGDLAIYHDDITKFCDVADSTVDLIVTSPPYNVDMQYATLKDTLPYDNYLAWSSEWISKVYDMAKPDGRFCLNVPMQTSKGEVRKIGVDLIRIAEKIGWQYKTTIIWDKGVCPKTQSRGTEMSPAGIRTVDNYELIIVFYKDVWQKAERKDSDMDKKEYLDNSEGIWRFQGRSDPNHPAPFPLMLPWRCIKAFSFIGDTVFEPFLGTGTTLIAASVLNRKGIGTDISEEYCEYATSNIVAFTKEGKRKLLEDAGIEYSEERDGITNAAILNKIKEDRAGRRSVVHNIKKFIK